MIAVAAQEKGARRRQILEALVQALESNPGERVTTATLANALGISEAALYRHFPSKGKMFEALIEFIEETVFSLITRILAEEEGVTARCERIISLLLGFSARNPGITRILVGDALVGETERLRLRIAQLFDRVEVQLKQILREAEANGQLPLGNPTSALANLMVAVAQGRMAQYVHSGFRRSPLEHWEQQWPLLQHGLFPLPEPA